MAADGELGELAIWSQIEEIVTADKLDGFLENLIWSWNFFYKVIHVFTVLHYLQMCWEFAPWK